jgi:hypothetical protein
MSYSTEAICLKHIKINMRKVHFVFGGFLWVRSQEILCSVHFPPVGLLGEEMGAPDLSHVPQARGQCHHWTTRQCPHLSGEALCLGSLLLLFSYLPSILCGWKALGSHISRLDQL